MLTIAFLLFACSPPIDTGGDTDVVDTDPTVDTADTDTVDTDVVVDTCTVGDNLTNPAVVVLNSLDLLIQWDDGTGMGADLPDGYFEAVTVDPESDDFIETSVDTIAYVSPHKLRIAFTAFPAGVGSLILDFPDRRNFVDCTHPGMDDVYRLHVNMTFTGGGFTDVTFAQSIVLGDI